MLRFLKTLFGGYAPPSFTNTAVQFGSMNADPNELHPPGRLGANAAPRIGSGTPPAFNTYDRVFGCQRLSLEGFYTVRDGVPFNPRGRTGLAGRGSLPRWGPNHAEALLISRYSILIARTVYETFDALALCARSQYVLCTILSMKSCC